MVAFCPYWAHSLTKFSISDSNWWILKSSCLNHGEIFKSLLSGNDLNLNMLLLNLEHSKVTTYWNETSPGTAGRPPQGGPTVTGPRRAWVQGSARPSPCCCRQARPHRGPWRWLLAPAAAGSPGQGTHDDSIWNLGSCYIAPVARVLRLYTTELSSDRCYKHCYKPCQKQHIENVAYSWKWNVHIWDRRRRKRPTKLYMERWRYYVFSVLI